MNHFWTILTLLVYWMSHIVVMLIRTCVNCVSFVLYHSYWLSLFFFWKICNAETTKITKIKLAYNHNITKTLEYHWNMFEEAIKFFKNQYNNLHTLNSIVSSWYIIFDNKPGKSKIRFFFSPLHHHAVLMPLINLTNHHVG